MTSHLDFLMRAILAELELLSTVAASGNEAKGKGGKPETRPPTGGDSPVLSLRRKYDQAKDDDERRAVIESALELLREGRYSKRVGSADMGTREGRLRVGRDPRPAGLLAYIYGYSVRHIHRLRKEARGRG